MFANLTRERETEILIAALIHEEIQTAAAAVAPAPTSYLSQSLSLSVFLTSPLMV